MAKLNIKALGLTFGIIWGITILIIGIAAACGSYGELIVALLGSIYIGYEASILGSLIGAIWGFVDAFIFGVIIAWLYNKFTK